MATRAQALEAERKAAGLEKRMGEMLAESGQWHELLQKQTFELQQEARAQMTGTPPPPPPEGKELETRNDWRMYTSLEFPKFGGEGLEGWLIKSECFFELAGIAEAERVRIAALHLEGRALQWHRCYVSLQGEKAYGDWENYTRSLAARFGAFDDPLSDLINLKQVSTLQVYMDAFDELLARTSLREDQALSLFLSGLVDELQMPIRMFKPKCLADAYALAKLQELTVKAMRNRYSSSVKPTSSNYKQPVTNVNGKGRKEVEGTQIMRIRGVCNGKNLRVLISTGSTHNILSSQMAVKTKCSLMLTAAAVEVANGQLLQCTQKCEEFEWEMQGARFKTEVHIVDLAAYDLILGVQWLSTLGVITWNFKTLKMDFQLKGSLFQLKGEGWTSREKQLNSSLYSLQEIVSEEGQLEEVRISDVMTAAIRKEEVWPEQLLASYPDIFEEPKGLLLL